MAIEMNEATAFEPVLHEKAQQLGLNVEAMGVQENGSIVFGLSSEDGKPLGSVITKGVGAEATNRLGFSLGRYAANGYGAANAVAAVALSLSENPATHQKEGV